MNIRWRLTTYYLIVVAVVVVVIGAFFMWFFEYFYMENLRETLLNKSRIASELVRELIEREASTAEIDAVCKKMGDELGTRFTVVDFSGDVLGDSMEDPLSMDNHAGRAEIQEALQNQVGSSIRFSSTVDKDMFYVALPVYPHSYGTLSEDKRDAAPLAVLRVALPLNEIKNAILRIQFFTLLALLISGVMAILVGTLLSRKITGPLATITSAAQNIASGDFEPVLEVKGDDELASLAGTVKEMGYTLRDKFHETVIEKNKIEAVINSINSGIVMFGSDLIIDIMNPAAGKMFDILPGAADGGSAKSFFRYHELLDGLEKVIQSGEQISFELNVFYPENIILQVSLIPLKNESGKVSGVLAVFHDITALRSMEKMRSEFVANVSHELRTPLTAIRGYAETLLSMDNTESDKREQFLGIIARETVHISSIVDSLMELSVIEEKKGIIKKQLLDIKKVLAESLRYVSGKAAARSISINENYHLEKCIISGNPDWLRQAIVNILDNAIKYGKEGGEVSVNIKLQNDEVVVSVEDDGAGIPAKDIPHIFERFYRVDKARTRKLEGAGLGLSIVKHILDAHQARYEIKSTEGIGTLFRFAIPLARKKTA